MTGVEGYVESAASGLVAGINAARLFKGEEELIFPHTTAIGSLPYYVTHAESKHFQPMNVNFGIIKELEGPRIRDKKERYEKIAERALKDLQPFIQAQTTLKSLTEFGKGFFRSKSIHLTKEFLSDILTLFNFSPLLWCCQLIT